MIAFLIPLLILLVPFFIGMMLAKRYPAIEPWRASVFSALPMALIFLILAAALYVEDAANPCDGVCWNLTLGFARASLAAAGISLVVGALAGRGGFALGRRK